MGLQSQIQHRWINLQDKARICARGFSQVTGIDYETPWSPTGRYNSLRLFLTIAAYHKFDIRVVDADTASFLFSIFLEIKHDFIWVKTIDRALDFSTKGTPLSKRNTWLYTCTTGFADANWASDKDNRKSTTTYISQAW